MRLSLKVSPILPTITPRDEFGGRARGRKTHRDTETSQPKVANSAQQTGPNMYVENGSLHISVQQGSAMSARMHEGVSDTSSEAATTASLPDLAADTTDANSSLSSLPSLVWSGYDSGMDTANTDQANNTGEMPMDVEIPNEVPADGEAGSAPYDPENPIVDQDISDFQQ